ncbi:MAG: hypothetical protein KY468_18070 [Armatimonadetes bacterium]|nr:hypothetical protein [Armatimonadota bacterium]
MFLTVPPQIKRFLFISTLLLLNGMPALAQSLTMQSPVNGSTVTTRSVEFVVAASGFTPTRVELHEGIPGDAEIDAYKGAMDRNANGTFTRTLEFTRDGTYTYYASATNGATGVNSPPVTFTINTSPAAPGLAMMEPTPGSTVTSRTVPLRAQATGFAPAKVDFYSGDPNDAFTDLFLASANRGANGLYETTHTFESGGAKQVYAYSFSGSTTARSPVVTFTISEPPVAGTDKTSVNIPAVDLSQANETPSVPILISNSGNGTLNWNLSANESWVFWDRGSGSIPAGGSETITVRIDLIRLSMLGPGNYSATLVIHTPGALTPKIAIPITLVLTDTAPANPVVRPPSQRFNVSVSGGRLRTASGDSLALFVRGSRVDAAQPEVTVNVQLQGPNGPFNSDALSGEYKLDRRQNLFFGYDPAAPSAPGDYTASLHFPDTILTKTFTIPATTVTLPAPQPTVQSYADGSFTVQWSAVTGASSYSIDVFEVIAGGGFAYVTGGPILRQTSWGFAPGTLQAGKTYQVTVNAFSFDPYLFPAPSTFTAAGGVSAMFTIGAGAPEITGTDPKVELCGRDATITWTTSVPATSTVSYGRTDSGFGLWTSNPDEFGTAHRVVVRNLQPGVEYRFQAVSQTATGQEWRSKSVTATVSPNAWNKRGDLNLDGAVNVTDAILSLQYAVLVAAPPTDQHRIVADVNADTALNVQDSILVLQIAVGLQEECP